MANEADEAAVIEELYLRSSMSNVSARAACMKGERNCIKCGYLNDRADAGYSVCTDCMEVKPDA